MGVVGEVKYRGLPENPTADPDLYLPFLDRNQQVSVIIRTSVPPASLTPAVRAAIRDTDATIPLYNVATMEERVAAQTPQSRFTTGLMGLFSAVALALAVIGIYGVMSYLVTRRTREIGVRLALGASRADVLRLIVGNGVRLIAAGVVLGVIAAAGLARVAQTLLFGVTPADASTAIAIGVLTFAALAACYLPALRASRLDPLVALRDE